MGLELETENHVSQIVVATACDMCHTTTVNHHSDKQIFK